MSDDKRGGDIERPFLYIVNKHKHDDDIRALISAADYIITVAYSAEVFGWSAVGTRLRVIAHQIRDVAAHLERDR